MTIKNTQARWGWLSKVFHWATALLIFIQIPLGFYAESLRLSPLKIDVFIWHKSLGMLVLLLVIVRLLWRIKITIPIALATSRLEKLLASAAHGVLYLLMLALPLSGWITSAAANFPVKLFWLIPLPPIVGPDDGLKSIAAEVHEICVFVLIAILVVHIGAALRHHFMLGDSALKRMWF
ncbi:MAG: cytochrome b/b6 domain-containing protein [Porticoccaceae bacterium]|nr:cytochrome b/b6 domain-containing protein [Porticoccaceae bacterium]